MESFVEFENGLFLLLFIGRFYVYFLAKSISK